MPRSPTLHTEACRWLVEQRIVRPGRTTLREIVGAAKESALQQVYDQLNGALSLSQQKRLDDLLLPVPAESPTEFVGRSRAEQFKLLVRRESPAACAASAARLADSAGRRTGGTPCLTTDTSRHPCSLGFMGLSL